MANPYADLLRLRAHYRAEARKHNSEANQCALDGDTANAKHHNEAMKVWLAAAVTVTNVLKEYGQE